MMKISEKGLLLSVALRVSRSCILSLKMESIGCILGEIWWKSMIEQVME